MIQSLLIATSFLLLKVHGSANPIQDGRPITLTLQAMRIEAALKQLSTATGLTLASSPQTADDVVTVRWKDAPLEAALDKLAQAVGGAWRREGQILRLIRTSDEQRIEEAHERAINVEEIRKAISKRIEEGKSQSPWSAQQADALAVRVAALMKRFNPKSQYSSWYQSAAKLSQEAPTGRVLTQILANLDPIELATVPTGFKTVWSTNPTAMQRSMPTQVSTAVDQFVQAQSEWNSALLRHSVQYPTFQGSTYMVNGFGELNHLEEGASPVATVLVSAQKVGELSGVSVEFSAFDSKGKRIAQSQTYLASEFMFAPSSDQKESTPPNEPMITLPADGVMVDKRLQSQGRSGNVTLSNELLSKLIRCDLYDPLAWITSPYLVAAAEVRGMNMVACLSDLTIDAGAADASNKLRVGQFFKRLEIYGCSVETGGGWLVVKPKRPVTCRSTRANRAVLSAYLGRLQERSPMHLEELAGFTLRLPDQQDNFLPGLWAAAISRSARTFNDANALRFLALTTKEQRKRMAEDGLPIRSLSSGAQNCIAKMVYGPYSSLQYTAPPVANPRQGINQNDFELYASGIMHESTEALPNGFPDQAFVTMKSVGMDVVFSADNGSRYVSISRAMTPSDLAWQKYSQERPDLFPWATTPGQQLDLTRLKFGQQLSITFDFKFTPTLGMSRSLTEQSSAGNEAVGIDSLPEEFRRAYEKAYSEYKQAYANAKPGQFSAPPGQQNIPPR